MTGRPTFPMASSGDASPLTDAARRGMEASALVDAAKSGDPRAFDALVRRYRSRIFALALHLTGSRSEADDITQDAFLRAYRNIGRFQGRSEFFTWLYRIALNRALNMRRDKRRRVTLSLDDRILWPAIAKRSWTALQELAEYCAGITVWVGLPVTHKSMMYNAAALIHDRSVLGFVMKQFLPTYSIFYEGRNWAAWEGGVTRINGLPAGNLVFRLPYADVSAEICEDRWSPDPPGRQRVLAGAEVLCNLSASPFIPLKNEGRLRGIHQTAVDLACCYVYSNLLGIDNSRIVFDGGGFIVTPSGPIAEGPLLDRRPWTLTHAVVNLDDISRARAENSTWRQYATHAAVGQDLEIVDARDGAHEPASVAEYAAQLPETFFSSSRPVPAKSPATQYLDELFDALVLGTRDYFEKSNVFDRYLVALSGGRDSALCLLLAVRAAQSLRDKPDPAERVWSVYLPNKHYSSSATEEAARALALELGVPFNVVSIAEEASIAEQSAELLMQGRGDVTAIARQNLQSRVRGNMMLNWGNSARGLVLVTSNLSEAAVGYTTTGGDNQGEPP